MRTLSHRTGGAKGSEGVDVEGGEREGEGAGEGGVGGGGQLVGDEAQLFGVHPEPHSEVVGRASSRLDGCISLNVSQLDLNMHCFYAISHYIITYNITRMI